jgi:hypothetical protein
MTLIQKDKVYIPIRWKESSFIQETTFERLPIDIYHIIHEYLSHYDYRQFMNSNKYVFHPIKYETVMYNLRGFHEWIGIELHSAELDYCCAMLMDNVKNKQNQVMIAATKVNQVTLLEACHSMFHGVHRVSFSFYSGADKVINNLSLRLFSNISHISLIRVGTISNLLELCGNIISLEIEYAENLYDISQVKNLPTLEKVSFNGCNKLQDISELKAIPNITIINCPSVPDISVIESNHKHLSYHSGYAMPILFGSAYSTFFQIEKLEINGNLSKCDFSFLQETDTNQAGWNLRYLTLYDRNLSFSTLPFQSRLYELNLYGFDLSHWKKTCDPFTPTVTPSPKSKMRRPKMNITLSHCVLPKNCIVYDLFSYDIQELELIGIRDLKCIDFTSFHHKRISDVEINECDDLISIIIGNNISQLYVTCSNNLESILEIGNCDMLQIIDCDNFYEISNISKINDLTIDACYMFSDLSQLITNEDSYIKEVVFRECSGITSLKGIIKNAKRISTISFEYCKRIKSIDGFLSDMEEIKVNDETKMILSEAAISEDPGICLPKLEISFDCITKQIHQDLIHNQDKLSLLQEYIHLTINGTSIKDLSSLTEITSDFDDDSSDDDNSEEEDDNVSDGDDFDENF